MWSVNILFLFQTEGHWEYISKTLMLRAIDIHEGETVFSHTSETTFLLRISLRAFFVGSYAVQRRRQILSKLIVLRKTRSLHWYSR